MKYKAGEWDLTDLVSKNANIDFLLKEVEKKLEKIQAFKPKFTKEISTTDFNKLIDALEDYDSTFSKIAQYASLKFSEDTSNKKSIALRNKIMKMSSEHSNKLLWFSLGFVKFPKKDCDRLIQANTKAQYHLKMMVLNKDYVLSDKEEKLINIKDSNGLSKLSSIYTLLSSSFMFDWEGKKITKEELTKYFRNPNRNKRKKAYELVFQPYKKYENIFSEIYTAILSDQFKEDIELRGYKSAISVRNKSNDIKDKTIETLMKVYRKNLPIFHRYFKLKAKAMKLEKLNRYDILAPLTEVEKHFTYEEASQIVLDTFKSFSDEFYSLAKSMFDKNHIHAIIQKAKRGGAFMSGVIPQIKPYVLLNYTNDWNNVSTMAHELGHAIHFMLSSKKNTAFHVHAAIPIAETASIFSELLLLEKIKKEKPELKKQLLFEQLDDAYTTIARQFHFTNFELEAHKLAKSHLDTDTLNNLYLKMLKEHYGDSVEVQEQFQYEWAYIPHIFYTPFYCYGYGFGNLLSFAAYKQYQETKDPTKLTKMLQDGGSKPPRELVRELGFKINSEEFWQKGFDIIKEMVQELEKL